VTLYTDKGRATLRLELQPVDREGGLTVDLQPVPADAMRLSICGDVVEYHGGGSGGQCVDTVREMAADLPAVQRLCDAWDRWHLNDLRAGTLAQTAVAKGLGYDAAKAALTFAGLYEDRGYAYGSKWLYEPLPADILGVWKAARIEIAKANEARNATRPATGDDYNTDDEKVDPFTTLAEENDIDEDLLRALAEHLGVDADDAAAYHAENYQGEFNDWEAFAVQLVDDLGYLNEMPEHLQQYFDFEKFGEDLKHDYFEVNGTYYRNA
jgi:hypothetical protein